MCYENTFLFKFLSVHFESASVHFGPVSVHFCPFQTSFCPLATRPFCEFCWFQVLFCPFRVRSGPFQDCFCPFWFLSSHFPYFFSPFQVHSCSIWVATFRCFSSLFQLIPVHISPFRVRFGQFQVRSGHLSCPLTPFRSVPVFLGTCI